MDDLKDILSDLVDSGDEEGNHTFFWQGVDSLANKTLAADRMVSIVDAGISEAARGAFERFVAIGKADYEQRVGIGKFPLKLMDVFDAIEKKVFVSQIGLFFDERFDEGPGILEGAFEDVAAKDLGFIVLNEIPQAFPFEMACCFRGDAGDFRKMTKGFHREI